VAEPIHSFTLEYCVPCNYIEIALGHTRKILQGWGPITKSFELIMASWGTFEVTLDGELIFSKWALGQRFPKPGELEAIIEARIGPPMLGWEDHEPSEVDPLTGRQILPEGFRIGPPESERGAGTEKFVASQRSLSGEEKFHSPAYEAFSS
jgi:selenoprotein W-related protein